MATYTKQVQPPWSEGVLLSDVPPVMTPLLRLLLDFPTLWLLAPYNSQLAAALVTALMLEGAVGVGPYALLEVGRGARMRPRTSCRANAFACPRLLDAQPWLPQDSLSTLNCR